MVFSPNGSGVVSVSDNGTVRIWDLASSIEILCCHARYPLDLEFSDDNSKLCVNGNLISLPPQIPSLTTTARWRGPSNVLASKLGVSDDWLTLSNRMIL